MTDQSVRVVRRVDLDWIRIAAFGLLILYHVLTARHVVSLGGGSMRDFESDALDELLSSGTSVEN